MALALVKLNRTSKCTIVSDTPRNDLICHENIWRPSDALQLARPPSPAEPLPPRAPQQQQPVLAPRSRLKGG